jgi:hypothetical protein
MGDAKGSTFEGLGAEVGSEGPRYARVPSEGCWWIGVGVLRFISP